MSLTGKQKTYLRGLAHHKSIIVSIGNAGLTDAVTKEIATSLEAHELLKIKLPGLNSADKKILITDICKQTNSEFVQVIGRVGVIYKESDNPKIELPNNPQEESSRRS